MLCICSVILCSMIKKELKVEPEVKSRLKLFLAYHRISQGAFEKRCGLSNGYVNNIRQSISPEKMSKILDQYPELNSDWLLVGRGEMLLNPNSTNRDVKDKEIVRLQKKIIDMQQEKILLMEKCSKLSEQVDQLLIERSKLQMKLDNQE